MATSQTAPSLGDRVLWTIVLGAFSGAAAMLAARLAEGAWRSVAHRAPPKPIGPMAKFAHKAGIGAFASLTHP